MNAQEYFSCPVVGADVFLKEVVDKVLGILFVDVFYAEVVDDQAEINGTSCVAEERPVGV